MAGTETLVPYLRETKGVGRPTVIVDSREAASAPKVVKRLMELGAEVRVEPLPRGDYVVSDRCAFERKTVRDFVYTLTRRFLFEQLFGLAELYERPFILLEGYLPIIYKLSRIQPSSVWGAIFALSKRGVFMAHTGNYRETADFLYTAARQEQLVEGRKPAVHPAKRLGTVPEAQLFLVASLPLVGREKATALLRSYRTPLNALNSVDRWAEDVYGLGPKTVERVKAVLLSEFEEEAQKRKNGVQQVRPGTPRG